MKLWQYKDSFEGKLNLIPFHSGKNMIKKILTASAALTPCLALATSMNISMSSNSDTGISPSDEITNINQPEFVGTSDANSTVKIQLNGINFNTKTNAQGLFFWQSMPLADGAYNLLAESNGETSSLSFVIDTEAFVSVDSKFDNGLLELSGDSEPNSRITIKLDGEVVGNLYSGGKWNFTLNPTKSGSMIEVSATDVAGNNTTQSLITQEEKPNHFLTANLSKKSDSGSAFDNITNHQSGLVFEGLTSPNSDIIFKLQGVRTSTTSDKDGFWSLTYNESLPNDYFEWIVESYAPSGDIVSNYGGVTIDTEAPEITVDNFLQMDEYGNIKVSGSSSEMSTMKITINGQVMILTTAGGDWVSKDVSGLKVGYSYPMTITSNDVAGNFSQTNVYRTVVK